MRRDDDRSGAIAKLWIECRVVDDGLAAQADQLALLVRVAGPVRGAEARKRWLAVNDARERLRVQRDKAIARAGRFGLLGLTGPKISRGEA